MRHRRAPCARRRGLPSRSRYLVILVVIALVVRVLVVFLTVLAVLRTLLVLDPEEPKDVVREVACALGPVCDVDDRPVCLVASHGLGVLDEREALAIVRSIVGAALVERLR